MVVDEIRNRGLEKELLSKEFIHIRVDWYTVDDRLYFGELTFYDGSGFAECLHDQQIVILPDQPVYLTSDSTVITVAKLHRYVPIAATAHESKLTYLLVT